MTEPMPDQDAYALRTAAVQDVAAPDLRYRPPMPTSNRARIGLIGAGGIAGAHLDAYRTAGWEVAAICNRSRGRAEDRAREFAPEAHVTTNWQEVIEDPRIDVVDITPHPADRLPIIEAALRAGKHVLSQKPFVLDLADGERLCDLADAKGLRLAVNQNGRWAPHLAWMREAVAAGLIGDVTGAQIGIYWDHSWIIGTPFERDPNLILFDFGIHWFDFLASVTGGRARSVIASTSMARGQGARVPLLAQAMIRLDGGQASLAFDGATPFGPRDATVLAGTLGSLGSQGPDLGTQEVTLTTAMGRARPRLEGTWFNDGFRGAMGELLHAIEGGHEPSNGARGNLASLAVAFAAVRSARIGREVGVGEATRLD